MFTTELGEAFLGFIIFVGVVALVFGIGYIIFKIIDGLFGG